MGESSLATVLAPGVIQVCWESRRGDRHARRTSIWCERETGWHQVHHRGTPSRARLPRAPDEGSAPRLTGERADSMS
ncbi:MAG TPA: hypothetical protein H9805_13830 [Candidatus Janibacter merdipullorum]|nr:hypothetical protein [Candidatus Janibacter merdipullorum]